MAELVQTQTLRCLEAQELIELAERGRKAPSYRQRIAHIVSCPACRATLRELQRTEAARPRRIWIPTLPGILVPATATACLLLLILVLSMRPGSTDAPSVATRAEPKTAQPSIIKETTPTARVVVKASPPLKPLLHAKPRKPRRVPRSPLHRKNPDVMPSQGTVVASAIPLPMSAGIDTGEVAAANTETGEVSSANSVEGEVIPAPPLP